MAEGDEGALHDGSADELAGRAHGVGDPARSEERGAESSLGGRGRVAVALAGLAVGVASAGLFLLPRLRTDVPVAPPEPSPGVVEPAQPIPGKPCPSRHDAREGL
jgi:hypothetical protein